MTGAFIVPTGIGCEIGGHAGDATPALRLIASVCDKIITHPNVVNASDLNEMPENALYVEGGMLDRFLRGKIELKEVKNNKILLVANKPIAPETLNAANAMRALRGINISVMGLDTPLIMNGKIESDIATGTIQGDDELIDQVKNLNFDALAIASPINVGEDVALKYFREGGVNPWGGVEAILSNKVGRILNKPVAHAPVESEATKANSELFNISYNEIVDPRMAAEAISLSYICCLFKGLHKAPRVGSGLSVDDVDFLISPYGCFGIPHRACQLRGIPIIVVQENECCLNERLGNYPIFVKNYLEATGLIVAMKEGISKESLSRPLSSIAIERKT